MATPQMLNYVEALDQNIIVYSIMKYLWCFCPAQRKKSNKTAMHRGNKGFAKSIKNHFEFMCCVNTYFQ